MNIKFDSKPMMTETSIGDTALNLKNGIINNNAVIFELYMRGKTQLSIHVRSGKTSFKMNEMSEYAIQNNLKFNTKNEISYLYGGTATNHYFKLTKKQNKEQLTNHLLSLTDMLFKDLAIGDLVNRDTFNITVWTPKEIL